ncbi:DUF4231 domain-containing protein [Kibdelosporangium lantanae]|uniref:DUF4231 domain-containing protein n=1 Tax=Kibdelosporangium lantanae TaxID=1497396 RepID=A0ABW3MEL7_9PSEU
MTEPSAATLEFVQSELDNELKRYARRRRRDKRKAFYLKTSTVTLSATISVLLGLRAINEPVFANVALGLGALITVLAAIDAFFDHRELWILRTHTVRDLQTLSRDLRYYVSGLDGAAPDQAEVDRFYQRLGEVIKKDDENWGKLRNPNTRP